MIYKSNISGRSLHYVDWSPLQHVTAGASFGIVVTITYPWAVLWQPCYRTDRQGD